MEFKKYNCPVCNLKFTDDDDVVVCPECGTPHHRECYKNNGKCFNEYLHGSNEDIKSTFTSSQFEIKPEEKENTDFPFDGQQKSPDVNNGPTFNIPDVSRMFPPFNSQNSPSQTHLINGREAVYYEIGVGNNKNYYMPRFYGMDKFKKGISANFFAFFLPLTFCFYRKMYKLGAIILAVYLLIAGVTYGTMYLNTDIVEVTQACMEEDMYFLTEVYEYMMNGETGKLTENQYKYIEEIQKGQLPQVVSTIFSAAVYIARFLLGLKANSLYMKKITDSIKKGESIGLSGDTLKTYIYKKNGTIPIVFAIFVAVFELFFI